MSDYEIERLYEEIYDLTAEIGELQNFVHLVGLRSLPASTQKMLNSHSFVPCKQHLPSDNMRRQTELAVCGAKVEGRCCHFPRLMHPKR